MGRSDEYRRYAAECLEMASVIHDPKARPTLLHMAQVWAPPGRPGGVPGRRGGRRGSGAARERLFRPPRWRACPRPMTYRMFRTIRWGWRPRIWLNWRWLNATRPARGSRHVRRYTESAEPRHHD